MSDFGLSQIGSEYDGLSEVRGQGGDFSLVQDSSSNIDMNSDALSEVGKVSSLEAASGKILLNVRRSEGRNISMSTECKIFQRLYK